MRVLVRTMRVSVHLCLSACLSLCVCVCAEPMRGTRDIAEPNVGASFPHWLWCWCVVFFFLCRCRRCRLPLPIWRLSWLTSLRPRHCTGGGSTFLACIRLPACVSGEGVYEEGRDDDKGAHTPLPHFRRSSSVHPAFLRRLPAHVRRVWCGSTFPVCSFGPKATETPPPDYAGTTSVRRLIQGAVPPTLEVWRSQAAGSLPTGCACGLLASADMSGTAAAPESLAAMMPTFAPAH